MDGNSRYAQSLGWHLSAGHEAGVAALRRAVAAAGRFGVRALTVYAFSEENWARGAAEVGFLMALFERALSEELPALQANRVRLRFIGDARKLPAGLRRSIARCGGLRAAGAARPRRRSPAQGPFLRPLLLLRADVTLLASAPSSWSTGRRPRLPTTAACC